MGIQQLEEKHVEFIVESPAYSLAAFRAFFDESLPIGQDMIVGVAGEPFTQ